MTRITDAAAFKYANTMGKTTSFYVEPNWIAYNKKAQSLTELHSFVEMGGSEFMSNRMH